MRSPQLLVLRPAARDFGTAPAGPAMTVLRTVVARIAVVLRGIALAEMVVQVILWRSFYLASPWRLWGPAVALAWGGTAIAGLRRRVPDWRFLCADTAVYAVLALTAGWCVPAAMRGEAGSWLFIIVSSQVVTPIWLAPRALSAPLAVTPPVAFAVGTMLAPAPHLGTGNPREASLILLLVVVAVHWVVRRMLYSRATTADAALAAADRDARDQYVLLSRNIERREQDRLSHDTVLNTLTAIARSGRTETVISQCRQDIAMLERALGESGGAASAGPPQAGPLAAIEAVVAEMRARGLDVDLEVTGDEAAESPAGEWDSRPASQRGAVMPGLRSEERGTSEGATREGIAVKGGWGGGRGPGGEWDSRAVAAIAHATREALANVAAHAGTGRAWVTVGVTAPDDGAARGRLQVTVRDAGAGFDPGGVDPARLGVRRSITERAEDWGGSASVRSVPGEGTVVCLSWPAASPGLGQPSAHHVVHAGTGQV